MRISLLAAAWLLIAVAVLGHSSRLEGRLLRMDPAVPPAPSAVMDHALAAGRPLFGLHCAACHGGAGEGDARRGIPDLADGDWLYGSGSVGDIERIIRYGIRSHHAKSWDLASMPAYATAQPGARGLQPLPPGAVGDLVEYLVQRQGAPADPEAAARGARLFLGAGGCYDCHAADARGDPAIGAPDLTDRITLYGDGSRGSLRASIEQGRHGMCPAWEGRLSAAAMREIAVYVYTLSHPRNGA